MPHTFHETVARPSGAFRLPHRDESNLDGADMNVGGTIYSDVRYWQKYVASPPGSRPTPWPAFGCLRTAGPGIRRGRGVRPTFNGQSVWRTTLYLGVLKGTHSPS